MAKPAELLKPARDAWRRGDRALAESISSDVARAFPTSPEPLKLQAEMLVADDEWDALLELTTDAERRFKTHQWWKQHRGEALEALERTDEAWAFYQRVLAEDPSSVAALKGLMNAAFNSGRWVDASEWARRGRQQHPDHRWWRQVGGWALERAELHAAATEWYRSLVDLDPLDQAGHSGLLNVSAASHDWPAVFERCRVMMATLDPVPNSTFGFWMLLALTTDLVDEVRTELGAGLDDPNAETSARCLETLMVVENHFGRHEAAMALAHGYPDLATEKVKLGEAYALMGAVRYDEADAAFAAIEGDASAEAGVARSLMCTNELRLNDAVDIILETHAAHPDNDMVWRTAFYLLQEASRFDDAERWLTEKREAEGDSDRLRLEEAGFHRSRMDFDVANQILDDLIDGESVDEKTRRAALLVRADTARRSQAEPERLAWVRDLLTKDPGRDRNGDYVLIRTDIALGNHAEAMDLIDALPDELDSFDANVFRAWAAAERGQTDVAKHHGERFLTRRFYSQVHSRIDKLEQRTSAPTKPGDIVAFAACRDEERRLPDFLRHHRAMGVNHFVIVDNKSSDRTSEYLSNQEDVSLFYTDDDYVMSGLGMRWMNELIGRLDNPHWVLFADVDELLIYPGYETRSLHDFTADLDRLGFEGAGGYMLDMHGETLNGTVSFRAGDSMVETSPYFTNAYDFQDFHLSPYVDVRGGFRSETLGIRNLQMTKTPLIRSDSGIQFLCSSHETTPGAIAKVATLFLHFKYIGDALARAEKEADWTPYMYYGNNTSKLRAISSGEDLNLLTPDAVRFTGSRQLVDLGLLRPLESP